jgi:hypothetical protein
VSAHVVQFSLGAGSAETAFRVHASASAGDRVVLLTADTREEHPDNWRYGFECVAQMPGVEWQIVCDGRTPMEVGRDERCVPNNRLAVCSRVLKRQILRRYIDEHFDPFDTVVYLGFDWTEEHRMVASVGPWEPWTIAAPLMAAPYLTKVDVHELHEERGIERPWLYKQGHGHANCGGACVRAGQAEWEITLRTDRPRFLRWEAEEETTRALLGKDVAILRDRSGGASVPLPLRVFRSRIDAQPSMFDGDDWGACGCLMDDGVAVTL